MHLRPLPGPAGAFGAAAPYGYGGPLADLDDAGFLARAWTAYTDWCRANGVLAEFCRFHPEAGNEVFFGAPARDNRLVVSVDLTLSRLDAQFSTLARRKLRLAQSRGAQARFSQAPADWHRFIGFYREAMTRMQAARWYHFTDAYFAALQALPVAWLCICEIEGEWASAGVDLFGESVVEYHLGASTAAGHAAGTAFLLQAAAARRAQEAGARSLYLGGGTSQEADNALLFHKKSFSRRLLPFRIAETLHDEDAYWRRAALAGHDRERPPARILLD
ncbi:MAG: GNAT family N-acetyltransferase [Comamonadaceae bacterium]|nr:MAG: GNAT family N-acetyltransferase [Comamonadaceae bacterium]